MQKIDKEKVKKIVLNIAIVFAFIGVIYSPGRLIFHDIPMLARGYEEVAIEWGEKDDYMRIEHTVATKTVKKKATTADAFDAIFTNLLISAVSIGLLVATWGNKKGSE